MLLDPLYDRLIERLLGNTSCGRPMGSDRCIAKLETMLNPRLRPQPRGRPRKANKR